MTERYPVIRFHQYGSDEPDDELLLFAAPASVIAGWAGIPRKGWRLRMLYQRWVTQGRERDVKAFWDDAGTPRTDGRKYLLGPTALAIAGTKPLDINDEGISLFYQPSFSPADDEFTQLGAAATQALTTILPRLESDEITKLNEVREDLGYSETEYQPNHILQSAIQIAQLSYDPEEFCARNEISGEERAELLEALDALCRPALVVDGQHRLIGAAISRHPVVLPVVLMPNANWLEQIYQFVVINETAKRVPGDLLTDIFGNSLSPAEQLRVRAWLANSHIEVESRIAAVIAGTNPDSPFRGLVRLRLGAQSEGFVTETTIRQLIEGGRGNTPGWRVDPAFYESYIRRTFPDAEEWGSWTSGRWQEYWFAFWDEVRTFYNTYTTQDGPLWGTEQTNLTKAVTLRLVQELFINIAIENAKAAEKASESLRSVLAPRMTASELESIIEEEKAKAAIPADLQSFRTYVREQFLSDGIPVRVFDRTWVTSLDDDAGINNLRLELRKAYDLTKQHVRYRAQNKEIFSVEDRDGA